MTSPSSPSFVTLTDSPVGNLKMPVRSVRSFRWSMRSCPRFTLIKFISCTFIHMQQFCLCLRRKNKHILPDMLQMICHCFLVNSWRGIDSEDHIACVGGDLCALVRSVDDARDHATLIADHHIAGLECLLLSAQESILLGSGCDIQEKW